MGEIEGVRQYIRRILLDYYFLARSYSEEGLPITGKRIKHYIREFK